MISTQHLFAARLAKSYIPITFLNSLPSLALHKKLSGFLWELSNRECISNPQAIMLSSPSLHGTVKASTHTFLILRCNLQHLETSKMSKVDHRYIITRHSASKWPQILTAPKWQLSFLIKGWRNLGLSSVYSKVNNFLPLLWA